MEKEYKKTKEAYSEILEVINKHKDIIKWSEFSDLESRSKEHLFGIELKEKYGLNVNPLEIRSIDYIRFTDYATIGWWGEKYRRTISWSDDNRQPEDELLFVIGFSTGAYIFGDDYPVSLFQEFFNELKSFNPTYTDTTNKNLFWSIETAKDIFNAFPEILKKYYEKNKEDFRQRKIDKLKKELESLSSTITQDNK